MSIKKIHFAFDKTKKVQLCKKILLSSYKNFNPKKRRDMSIAFVPENRLGHSAVPELTLSENILISQFPNNNFINNGIINCLLYTSDAADE